MSNQLGSLKMGQKYKKSPVGEIPVEWEARELGGLCETKPEYGANVSAIDFQKDLPRYVRITDINDDGSLTSSDVKSIRDADAKEYLLKSGEIIFARSGATVGKTYLYRKSDGPCAFAGYTIRFRPNPAYLMPEFVFQFTHSDFYYQWVKGMLRAGAQPNINGSEYSALVLPVPPIIEQRRIVAVLSSVDELAGEVAGEIEKTRKLKNGLMRQLLTRGIGHKKFKKTEVGEIPESWRLVTFGDAFSFLRNGSNSRDELTDAGDVGYVHYGDLHTKWQTKLDCSEVELPKIEAKLVGGLPFLKNGDLIIADASEDYAGVGVAVETVNVGEQKIVAGLHTMLLRDKTKIFADGFRGYIQYIPAVHDSLVRVATGGSVYGISKSNVQTVKIPCPPHKEQEQIKGILAELDSKLKNQKIFLEKISGLKMSLMSVLLTGKVRVLK